MRKILKFTLKKTLSVGIISFMTIGIVTTINSPVIAKAEIDTDVYEVEEYDESQDTDYYTIDVEKKGDIISLNGQPEDTTVKTLKKETVYHSDGSLQEITEYDKNGNEIKNSYYNDSVWFEYNHIYEFDQNGNKIKEIKYNPDGSIQEITEYDFNGNKTKYIPYNDGSISYSEEYEYDPHGNLTKSVTYNSDGSLSYYYTYEYDNEKMVKSTQHNTDGSILYYYTYEYDENDNEIKNTCFKADNSTSYMYTYTYEYDKNGNIIKKITSGPNGTIEEIMEYDADGNITYHKIDISNHYIKYKYDDDGDIIEYTIYNIEDDLILSYTKYEYYDPITYTPMYRLYNPNSGEHFYTANETEKDNLSNFGWIYEGIAWNAPETSDTPVYRLYNPNAGDHHYTTSKTEKDNLVSVGWKFEGIGWYSAESDGQALYRLYNPNATGAGSHHYTTNADERDNLISLGWRNEGIAWYGGK
ncbi:MAG: hypothetical protein IJV15_04820 [Lachnospiraceae bacterium]|nr:hypothetical protein [Lachnospiraceae bacterium]